MNTLGHLFRVTSFGESHGSHIGCVIDGCPAGLIVNPELIQKQVDRRKTFQSSFSTERKEEDKIEIISGIFEDKTTGSPIAILVKNNDAHSSDYDELRHVYRPNHADYTNEIKFGHRDHRGGGRSSIRVTAPLVAAGEIANQLLQTSSSITTQAYVSQIGKIAIHNKHDYPSLNLNEIDRNEVRCPDQEIASQMIAEIEKVKQEGDTLGGMITCVIQNLPVGLGEPIFSKLQAQLAKAMLSINTVKGFEYGYGFDSVSMKGSDYNDSFIHTQDGVQTKSNRSGGIQGGISNGMDIYFHIAFKPISSIKMEQETINKSGQPLSLQIKGRHDVCAVPRAIPIVEAYTNIVLADAFLQAKLSKL